MPSSVLFASPSLTLPAPHDNLLLPSLPTQSHTVEQPLFINKMMTYNLEILQPSRPH